MVIGRFSCILPNSFSLIHPQRQNRVILDFVGFYQIILACQYICSGGIRTFLILLEFYQIVLAGFIYSGKIIVDFMGFY